MSKKGKDICDDYGFCFLDKVEEPAIQLIAVGRQSRNDESYHWNNRERPACFLFQYTLNGSGTLNTNEDIFTVKKGEAFFLRMPEDEAYYFDKKRNQAPWEFVYIMFGGRAVSSYYKYVLEHVGKIMSFPVHHPAVKQLLNLYFQARNGFLKNAFTADAEVFRFLCFLCDMNGTGERHSSLTDRAKAYMDRNFDRQITLLETADHLGVSQSHLSREFLKYTGEQPIRYLTKIRLEHAVQLLHSTDMTVDEISASCGFSDGNYFSKVFKRYMQTSPGELRRQIKAQGFVNVRVL